MGTKQKVLSGKINMCSPVLETLIEYHEQSVEDCRIIGTQKYNVLISLSVALASFIYALISLYSSLPTIQNIIYSSSNSSGISQLPSTVISIAALTLIIALFSFVFVYVSTITSFLFLVFHLPLMTELSIKIEELQRDILFSNLEERYIDLFSWKGILTDSLEDERKKFKDCLQEYFVFDEIKSIVTSEGVTKTGNNLINICVNFKFSMKDLKIKNLKHPTKLFSGKKKSGTLYINETKNVAILNIENHELDRFNVNDKNGELILYESELKYRFRKVMPHFSVYNPSKIAFNSTLKIFIIVLLILGIICNFVLPYLASNF